MKKRDRSWRPSDGYEIANSSNMFLDLKAGENDREEYLSDKVRKYLQSLGMLSESLKLDKMFYGPLEKAIQSSSFWTMNNDYDESDLYTYTGEDAIQTDAARALNLAIEQFLKEEKVPIVVVIESTDPGSNKESVVDPEHSNYPNKPILGGFQSLTKGSRFLIVLHMATFSDDFDVKDVSSSAISRQIGRVIRHEAIHADQLSKRSKSQKISRKKAKQAYLDQGLIPGSEKDVRVQYLSSHIEIDAYAHEIAEELYDVAGYEGALDVLRNTKKVHDYPVSAQTKEYLSDYAEEDFTFKLIKKIYTHLENFKKSKVLERRILKRIMQEGLTSYDVEDVYSTARLAHLGQMRRDGKEYFTHPREVANIVRKYYPKDTRAYLVALLHDTIEDTEGVGNLSVKELTTMIDASIGDPKEAQDIINAVNALTHAKNQPYVEYVQSLTSNPLALKVKLADMMHNLGSTPTERQKLKYEKAISALSQQHSGNIPGVSSAHVKDLLSMTEAKKRKPRKKGQHRNSPNHSDLFTDENPKGTIKGLKFATVKDAEASVNKIKRSGKSHAHKTQAAIAMEQRAKTMGKKSAAAVYRKFINQQKEKTKKKNESIVRSYVRQLLKEDPIGFVQDLATSDKFRYDPRVRGAQVGKAAGRDIKRAFNKNADHQFLSTLDTVHWAYDFYELEPLKGKGKDELSTTMSLPGDSFDPPAGLPYGLWIKGRITLAANEQDQIYSGFYGDYGVGLEGDEEAISQRDRSSGRNKRPTTSKDYRKFRAAEKGKPAHEKAVRKEIPYVLDQSTWDPSKTTSTNEALVDNWRPRGIIVVKADVEDAILKTAKKLAGEGGTPPSGKIVKDIDYFSVGVVKTIMLASLDLGVPIYSTDRTILWSPK